MNERVSSAPSPSPSETSRPAEPRERRGLRRSLRSIAGWLTENYATADPRSLGLFRIALGLLLFGDVLRRAPDLAAHYSNSGWLTNHFALFRPMSSHLFSVYLAFSTLDEVRVLFVLHLLVNFLLLIGWHTRIFHVLAAVLITSMNSRNILLENGGWVVLNLLTVWTMFLPLGRRFSVDALLSSLRQRRESTSEQLNDRSILPPDRRPVVSLAVAVLIAQWAVIYYFNVVHKSGQPWRDGTAVYYFFQQDRMVTAFGAWLRDHLSLAPIKLMTWGTLAVEFSVFVLLVIPAATYLTRMLAWLLVATLHLSIDLVVQLGPFSYAMAIMFFVLIPTRAWERFGARARKRPERRLYYVADDRGSLLFCRLVKRLDPLELVRFVEIRPGDEDWQRVSQTLVVKNADGSETWTELQALLRLSEALPLGGLLAPLRLPGLRALGERLIARWQRRPSAFAQYVGSSKLAELAEPPGESPARAFVGRLGFALGQACLVLLIAACGSQVLVENRAVPESLKPKERPEWLTAIVVYPRLFQGWSMFAPVPPMDDGKLVVEGRTADGRKLDPLTGKEPDYDLQPKGGFSMNQIWGDFHRRIAEPRFNTYLGGVSDFLLNHHEITGRPQDRLVAFEVWFVSEVIPPPGSPKPPPSRRKITSHGTID